MEWDIQWECKANIDSNYKFGSLDVICEGYDFADDDYVLVGSCGLEYRIEPTTKQKGFPSNPNTYSPLKNQISNGFSFGFIICLFAIIFIIYYTCLRPNGVSTDRDNRRTRAPPPPGFRPDFFDNSEGCSSSSGFSGYTDNSANRNTGNSNGFFSGLLAGRTLGYLFGSRNTTNYRDQSSYFGRRTEPPPYFSEPKSGSYDSPKTTTSGFGGTKRR